MTGRIPPDQAALQHEIARLHSFPELNPNPILELSLHGKIVYANPAACELFPDLEVRHQHHPYLAGWDDLVAQVNTSPEMSSRREVSVGVRVYLQSICFVKEFQLYHIYGLDITDQKLVEEELNLSNDDLNEQRAFLQAILLQLPLAVGVFDANTGQQILSDPVRDEILGIPQVQVGGFGDFANIPYFHLDGTPYTQEELPLVRTFRSGGPVYDEKMRIKRGDGTDGVITVNSAPVYLNGEMIAGVNLISDITDRERAERALQESEERYRTLVETSPSAIVVHREGRFLFANQAALDLYGATNFEQLSAYTILGLVPDSNMEKTCVLINQIEAGNRVAMIESQVLRLDGKVVDVEVTGSPVDYQGIKAVQTVLRDVTQRKKAENEARASEEKYRQLIETSNEGVWVADAQQRTTFVNRQMAEMLGYTPEEMMGKRSIEFMDAESQAKYPELIARRRRGVKDASEHKFVRKDGTILWVISNAVPILDEQGQFAGSFGMLTDITVLKNRQQELDRVNRTLRAISGSNQAMMRAQGEREFIQEVCRIVVEDCGHAMVWVGFAEHDPGKTIRPVVSAGFDEGYLQQLNLTWADTERGRGPGGTAIRTGQISICRNMLSDPNFGPWRAEALKRGYASSIVLPLSSDGKVFGELTIYSRDPDPYTKDEVDLLSELANDLAYGITMLRLRAAEGKSQAALKASEEKYRSLFNGMTEGFALHEIVLDRDGQPCDYRFLEINPAFEHLTGLTAW